MHIVVSCKSWQLAARVNKSEAPGISTPADIKVQKKVFEAK